MSDLHPLPSRPPWLWCTLDLYEQLRLMRLTQVAQPPVQKHSVNQSAFGGTTTGGAHNNVFFSFRVV